MASIFVRSLLFFALFTAHSLFANGTNYAYQLQRYSPDEGLSQGDVVQTIQDDLGFIWVATGKGLNRFDGYEFSLFEAPELEDKSIVALYKTYNGDILASTAAYGLYRINPKSLETTQVLSAHLGGQQDEIDTVYVFSEDQQRSLWLGIDESVYQLSPGSKTPELKFKLTQQNEVIRAFKQVDVYLYIGATDGLYRYDTITGAHEKLTFLPEDANNPDSHNVKYLRYDDFNGLTIGTVAGLFQLPLDDSGLPAEKRAKTLLPQLNIWDIVYQGNQAFIATERGLYQFDLRTKKSTNLLRFSDSKYDIQNNSIVDLFADRTGRLWLASRGQGVFTWSPSSLRFSKIQPATHTFPGGNMVWSLYQDEAGELWVGTENGLTRINLTTQQKKGYLVNENLKAISGEQSIYRIIPANESGSRLWLGTSDGLRLFDTRLGKLLPLNVSDEDKKLLQSPLAFGFSAINEREMAFYSPKDFYRFDGHKVRIIKGLKEKIAPLDTRAFLRPLPDHPNELLIATTGQLYLYNEQTQQLTLVYQVKQYNRQNEDMVENWVLDHANTLWLTVDGEGLIGLDSNTYQERFRIDQNEGLLTNTVYSPMIDPLGNIWFSSHNGLYRLKLGNQHLRHFSVRDGLPANEFNGYANITLKDGRMVYGSVNGLVLFIPESFVPSVLNQPPRPPVITDVSLFSRKIAYYPEKFARQAVELKHNDIGLLVKFASFDLQNTANTHYRISLEGPTSFTHLRHTSNKVFFAKLLPGHYTLNISAYDSLRGSYTRPVQLTLDVAYPPWRSPTAYAAYGVALLALIVFLYLRHRTRRRELQQAHDELVHSEQQTQLALANTQSGIWHFDADEMKTMQPRLKNELGYVDLPDWIPINQFFSLMHPQDAKRLLPRWRTFIKHREQEQWEINFRLRHADGHWVWYHDIGKVVTHENSDKLMHISGIYTNITQSQATAQQARVLGEAVGQINDWLLILDENRRLFSANQSFIEAFQGKGHGVQDKLGIYALIKALGKQKYRHYMKLLEKLKAGQHWRGDDSVMTRYDGAHPVHISITAAAREGAGEPSDEISYYVVVISDLSEQKRAESELRFLANYDPLTRLPNRTLMRTKIEQALEKAHKQHALVALLFIDLDKFKPVNDSFGHAVGDQVLCNICRRMELHLDANSMLGRQSGDEFLLLIEKVESPAKLRDFVATLIRELAQPIEVSQYNINISASIGVAMSPFDANNAEDLIRNADMAMIHAKQAGRNGFKFFTEQMNNRITQKLLLENALQEAFRNEDLQNYYQPIVNNQKKSVVGVELLLRWEHEGRFVSPGEFIPAAEEVGLIDAVTEQALHRALNELEPLLSHNEQFYVSLNLSPMHILKSNLSERLQLILKTHNVPVDQLRLEITENTLLEDKQKATEQLKRLRSAGFKLFLDDFGTGYSSLTYLSHFPIQVIKIDQSFVSQIGINPSNESIIRTIHTLAKNLGLYCIAEGVETREQIDFLSRLGCHSLQGFYYARPVNAMTLLSQEFQQSLMEKL